MSITKIYPIAYNTLLKNQFRPSKNEIDRKTAVFRGNFGMLQGKQRA